MLADAKLIAFAATADACRARDFYCGLLGLTEIEESEFALVLDANGVELRLQKVAQVLSPAYTSLGWRVASIGEVLRGLRDKGVAALRYEFLDQDKDGVWQSPSGAAIAWFMDPDGNLLSLTQHAVASDAGMKEA